MLLAFGRFYVGAHYPGDVLGGLAFGAVVVGALYYLAMRILVPIAQWVGKTPLAWFVTSGEHGVQEDGPPPDAQPSWRQSSAAGSG